MRKLFLTILSIILLVPWVAATTVIPVPVDVNVDFENEHEFTINLPNGGERHFDWDNGTMHSDVSYTQTVYYTLDEEKWCGSSSSLGAFQSMSDNLAKFVSNCDDLQSNLADYEAVKKDRDIYMGLNSECQAKVDNYDTLENEKDTCENALTQAQRDASTYKSQADQFNECDDDLDSCNSSKMVWGIVGALLGGGIVFFFLRGKNTSVPAEAAEAGAYEDSATGRRAPERQIGFQEEPYEYEDYPRE